jgi:hypothetical protein
MTRQFKGTYGLTPARWTALSRRLASTSRTKGATLTASRPTTIPALRVSAQYSASLLGPRRGGGLGGR